MRGRGIEGSAVGWVGKLALRCSSWHHHFPPLLAAAAVFGLLAGTELTDGVWYPLGGFRKVSGF